MKVTTPSVIVMIVLLFDLLAHIFISDIGIGYGHSYWVAVFYLFGCGIKEWAQW